MDGYIGEIKMFAGNYPPAAWSYCYGQILAVSSCPSLFAVMGATFGGDGINTFGLPDLRGRTSIGAGTGQGLSPKVIGQMGGYDYVVLDNACMPAHTHGLNCDMTSDARSASPEPEERIPAKLTPDTTKGYGSNFTGSHTMNPDMLETSGSGWPFGIDQPWLCINHIICIEGNWPPRS